MFTFEFKTDPPPHFQKRNLQANAVFVLKERKRNTVKYSIFMAHMISRTGLGQVQIENNISNLARGR